MRDRSMTIGLPRLSLVIFPVSLQKLEEAKFVSKLARAVEVGRTQQWH